MYRTRAAATKTPVWIEKGFGACAKEEAQFLAKSSKDRTDEETELGKALCGTCGVRVQCLDYALKTNQTEGIWGGFPEEETRAIRLSRQSAAAAIQAEMEQGVIYSLPLPEPNVEAVVLSNVA